MVPGVDRRPRRDRGAPPRRDYIYVGPNGLALDGAAARDITPPPPRDHAANPVTRTREDPNKPTPRKHPACGCPDLVVDCDVKQFTSGGHYQLACTVINQGPEVACSAVISSTTSNPPGFALERLVPHQVSEPRSFTGALVPDGDNGWEFEVTAKAGDRCATVSWSEYAHRDVAPPN